MERRLVSIKTQLCGGISRETTRRELSRSSHTNIMNSHKLINIFFLQTRTPPPRFLPFSFSLAPPLSSFNFSPPSAFIIFLILSISCLYPSSLPPHTSLGSRKSTRNSNVCFPTHPFPSIPGPLHSTRARFFALSLSPLPLTPFPSFHPFTFLTLLHPLPPALPHLAFLDLPFRHFPLPSPPPTVYSRLTSPPFLSRFPPPTPLPFPPSFLLSLRFSSLPFSPPDFPHTLSGSVASISSLIFLPVSCCHDRKIVALCDVIVLYRHIK